MSSLESILSGSAPASEPEVAAPVATPETTQEQPQGQPEPSSSDEPQPDDRGTIPIAALHAERNKVKRYTEQVAEFQTRLEQQNAQWEQRFTQIIGAIQQPKQAQPEQAQAPDLWENPNGFVQHEARQVIEPLQEQLRAMARTVAEVQFQPDTVAKAVDAFDSAVKTGQIDPEIHRRIMASTNPYAAAVQWHQHTSTMTEIGSDPAAYKAKLRDELKAEIMAELNPTGQQSDGNQPAPVMPSNFAAARNVGARSGPAWTGPPTLDDIFRRK